MEHRTIPAQLTFFNEAEAVTVDAMVACIIPGDASSPGAREAGALVYIDRVLAGYYHHLQTFYQRGLRELDTHCRHKHGAPFVDLSQDQREAVLTEIDPPREAVQSGDIHVDTQSLAEKVEGRDSSNLLLQFFAVVREHTIEGTFGDPAYGGNHGGIGWKMVGFPGAQWGYTAEQMAPNFDATTIPVSTLADLRREYGRWTEKE